MISKTLVLFGLLCVLEIKAKNLNKCEKFHGKFMDKIGCHEYYQRGPCAEDEVVIHNSATGYAVCAEDKCLTKNSKYSIRKKNFAPVLGKGRCARLGNKNICSFVSNKSKYHIDENEHIPTCSDRTKDWSSYVFLPILRKDIKSYYNCTNWFAEVLFPAKCICKEEKVLSCGMIQFRSGTGAKTFCWSLNMTCRQPITKSTSKPKIFINDLRNTPRRRNNNH